MKPILSLLRRPLALLFFSALLSALPLSFPSLYLLSWVSFSPFFYVLIRQSGKGKWMGALGRGVFFGFLYHGFVYFWFLWLYPLDFAGLSPFVSVLVVFLAWFGISFLHGILYAIPTLFCHFLGKAIKNAPLVSFAGILGILFAQRLTEYSQLAFPWVKVSLGQYRASALIQSASLLGSETVDFLILSVSALIALAFCAKKKKRLAAAGLALLLFLSNLAFGLIRLAGESGEKETILVTSVQGCILSGEKWSGTDESLEAYLSLTEENAGEACDLVVWPESAVAVNLASYPEYISIYQELSRDIDAPILMGCFSKIDGVTSNSAILLDEDSVSQPYSKQILVPFGERMPYRALFSTLFPFLEEINMLSSDLASGEGSVLMDLNGKKIGTVICFESIFPSLVRRSVCDGAELLVVVTNDSWYEDSPAVWQHLAHSVFRSVENNRSVVRCANSGVSAFIDEKGRITSELGPLEKGVLEDRVSFSDKETLYSRVGNILLPACFALFLLWFGILLFLERRRRHV